MPDAPTTQRPEWSDLLPAEDYRFHLGVRPGNPSAYFGPTPHRAALLAERKRWLTLDPQRYAGLLPEAVPLLEETLELAHTWGTLPESFPARTPSLASPWDRCLALGQIWEPDYLLLSPDATGSFVLRGGCVCFPSAWSFEEKLGHPLEFIHGVVPGLNPALGKSIQAMLSKMRPGTAWVRSNWSLTRLPELNQHPKLALPRLTLPLSLAEVWLRSEYQILVPLPRHGGILFGIRLEIQSLAELVTVPSVARGLKQALETMPEAMAVYKNIASVRTGLIDLLNGPASQP